MTTDLMAVRGCLAAAISRPLKPMSVREEDFERDQRITRWLDLHKRLHHADEPEHEPDPPAYTDENDPKEDVT